MTLALVAVNSHSRGGMRPPAGAMTAVSGSRTAMATAAAAHVGTRARRPFAACQPRHSAITSSR